MEPSILATLLSLGSGVILGLAASGIRALMEPSLRPVTSGQFGKLRLSLRRARTGKMRDKTDFDGRCTNGVVRQSLTRIKVPRSHKPMKRRFGTTQ